MANKLLPDKPPKVILELLITLLQLILSRLDIFRKLVATGGQYLTAGLQIPVYRILPIALSD
ncbi:hypothetical protein [Xenorhabdus bovienii]|uniref:hypothetical protein n=1 Tax=Xenorhabdus bovienii TaxID=40576 RepID=UPI0023B2FA24|nr:hypothetical protein [Xenorhabdus bovienii]MDE9463435.1 hypothetical protein [Xenorhabdus bovienii]MDE9471209.1 hypothetical protein [Xenorhabdus bovienii]